MKPGNGNSAIEARAAEAVDSLLHQSSVISVKEIRKAGEDAAGVVDLVAAIGLLGHPHTLICKVSCNRNLRCIRAALQALHKMVASSDAAVTPLLIAPSLSPRAKELCSECGMCYLDFDGNARLEIGEVFIRRRCMPRANAGPLAGFPPEKVQPAEVGHRSRHARCA